MNCTTKTIFNGVEFKNCLMNASGCVCAYEDQLTNLYLNNCGGFISKTCSTHMREGNLETPRFAHIESGTINSMGLPNQGADYYIDLIKKFTDKPYFISVAANYLSEDFEILYNIEKKTQCNRLVEINVSCPNIPGKEQLAYNFEDLDQFLRKLSRHKQFLNKLIIGLKLPPYFDPAHFVKLRDILLPYIDSKCISFLTAINSIGNTLIINSYTESPIIKPKGGLGGLGGEFIKPTALSNVWQLYKIFEDKIPIIGCGGIKNGEDAFEHILCGASLVQIGSQLMKEGPNCFSRINKELIRIMEKKRYETIEDFRGKLKQ